jgi:predicted acyl esterase
MSAASEQDPNLLTPSHPNEASPGRNDIVVATMHYGHKRMSFKKDVAIQMRDGTVLYVNVFRPSEEGRYPVVVTPLYCTAITIFPKCPPVAWCA